MNTPDIVPIHRTEYDLGEDRAEAVCAAEAPGRIHYLGEHGEEGAGLLLSSAIDRTITAAVSRRRDNALRFFAATLGERKRTTLVNLRYRREDRWANHIKLAIHIFAEMGYPVRGLNWTITGNIPQNIGLASSTAIEVAAFLALKGLFGVSIGEEALIARLLAAREVFFEKKPSAVDYRVILSAKRGQFLLVDEAAGSARPVKSPLGGYKILLMDSRVPRPGVEAELNHRKEDTRKGLALLSKKKELSGFRDVAPDELVDSTGSLPEEIRRRSLHVVEELRRVGEMTAALQTGDFEEIARLIYESHESLRDLYEVSCPELDWLVKRSQETEGVLASRMTGAGFGGATYTFLTPAALPEYRRRMEEYERIFGFHPHVYEVRPATGAKIIQKG